MPEEKITKKQTRKSISISDESYQKLKKHCEDNSISMSGWLEDQAAKLFEVNKTDLAESENGNGNGKKFPDKIFELPLVKEPAKKVENDPIRGGGTHLL